MNELLLTFYGDDFTGSTDAMEALTLNGVPTALFLEPPTPEQLTGRFAGVRAVGVPGTSRSMPPDEMTAELLPKFRALKALGAPLTHYKVCSTFDSAPTVGSIGHAIDLGFEVFGPLVVPLLVGATTLRRDVAFGNLFATVGQTTYRLDRHPTMSRHPITPMHESDLRLHLGQQTRRRIGLIDLLQLEQPDDALRAAYWQAVADGAEIVLFDTLNDTHLLRCGRLIWETRGDQPGFIAGSSGVEYALTAHWQAAGMVQKPPPLPAPGAVDQLLVLCGSASPVTASQIEWALAHGYSGLRLDTPRLADPTTADRAREDTLREALDRLARGESLLLYAAQGPDDPAIAATQQALAARGLPPGSAGSRLGRQQGLLLRELLARTGLRRACVAGGDTSGHSAAQLGIYALEVLAPITPGAPLCRASSHDAAFDGLQISLKGGQNGGPDYFEMIRQGHN